MTRHFTRLILAAACVGLTLALVHGGGVPATAPGLSAPQRLEQDDAILDRRIPELNFDNAPLVDVIDRLAQLTQANLVANWRSLEGAGIDRNAPIRIHAWNVTLRQALGIISGCLAGENVSPVVSSIENGIVTISTRDDLDRNLVTEIYNIRQLVIELCKGREPRPRTQPYNGASADYPSDGTLTHEEAVEQITRLITDTIAPDSWRDAGGTVGSIREFGGLLIMTQTPENQLATVHLLEKLGDANGRQTLLPATRPGKPNGEGSTH